MLGWSSWLRLSCGWSLGNETRAYMTFPEEGHRPGLCRSGLSLNKYQRYLYEQCCKIHGYLSWSSRNQTQRRCLYAGGFFVWYLRLRLRGDLYAAVDGSIIGTYIVSTLLSQPIRNSELRITADSSQPPALNEDADPRHSENRLPVCVSASGPISFGLKVKDCIEHQSLDPAMKQEIKFILQAIGLVIAGVIFVLIIINYLVFFFEKTHSHSGQNLAEVSMSMTSSISVLDGSYFTLINNLICRNWRIYRT